MTLYRSSTDLANLRGPAIGCLNIQSMTRKLDDVRLLLARSQLNCLGLVETWLNNSICDSELFMQNYDMIRYDTDQGSTKRGGGGLLFYVDRKYQFQPLPEWHICNPDIEIGWIKLHLKLTKPTYIGLIYRPPSGNYENCLEIIEQKLIDINSEGDADLLLIGDININLLSRGDCMVNRYRKWIHEQRLKSMINTATRITKNSRTCIDHILTNRQDLYHNAAIFDPGLSDHNMIFASRKKKRQPRTHTCFL